MQKFKLKLQDKEKDYYTVIHMHMRQGHFNTLILQANFNY